MRTKAEPTFPERRTVEVSGASTTGRFRCPECGIEREVTPRHGDEVVSVYCLGHVGGISGRSRLVYMTGFRAEMPAAEPEPVSA